MKFDNYLRMETLHGEGSDYRHEWLWWSRQSRQEKPSIHNFDSLEDEVMVANLPSSETTCR